ncbi:MAG: hypothetical protein ABI430_05180 [Candidatus Taylorbacteria bacterium]
MLYLLYGENKDQAREKARGMIDNLKKKKPDAAFFHVTTENWNEATLEEYIGGQGLFSNKYIVFVDSIFENKEIKEVAVKKIKEMAESQNIFIVLEGELDKATFTKFEKCAEKVQSFGVKGETHGEAQAREFNIFSLGDALGRRDKKNLWVLYNKAKRAGLEDEQIHGTLFWSVKNMILACNLESAKEAGLNPYVFGKARNFAHNFKYEELGALASGLVALYHDSRRGISDLDVALERFILSI